MATLSPSLVAPATILLLLFSIFPPIALAVCGRDARQIVPVGRNLAVAVCSPLVARIVRTPPGNSNGNSNSNNGPAAADEQLRARESLVVQPGYSQPPIPGDKNGAPVVTFNVTEQKDTISIDTGSMRLEISKADGNAISFYSSSSGKLVNVEQGSTFTPQLVSSGANNHTDYSTISQSWSLAPNEGFYGGGQYANGHVNYAAAPLLMVQSNTEAVVPFFVSSNGYGILWDHYGITHLNPLNNNNNNKANENEIVLNDSGRGTWTPPSSGNYWIYVQLRQDETSFGGENFELYLDGESKCEHHLANVPSSVSCRVDGLSTRSYQVYLDSGADGPKLWYNSISDATTTTIKSEYSNYIDYYFIVAANETADIGINTDTTTPLDSVIRSYREITGTAKLYPKWAYGFWQCKEHYHNQTEILAAAAKFRNLKIPVDSIVQDWMYWGEKGWGPQWDPKVYPDPGDMVAQLQNMDFHFMVSVWSRFAKKTSFYQEMSDRGLLINGSDYMDAWDPAARSLFFDYSKTAHFDIGVDSLWLDATEPENNPHRNQEIFLGAANEYYNTFSLQVGKAIHDGLKEYDGRRVFSLTRSSFAGQQRYGSCLWSGDTSANWDSLRRQIAMSINYQLSGIPYWSMDIGGFFRPKDQYESLDYAILLKRWFQFAIFIPIMRVHGGGSNTELWNYGQETQDDIVYGSIYLRYRLLDYVYSNFAKAEKKHYAVQRGLVMDFPHDPRVQNIADEYMFGQSFLVAPIYTPDSSRNVYLPSLNDGGKWRNFYTGEVISPGDHSLKDVPIGQMALYARSSILVLSPLRQHVFEDVGLETLEVRVYDGAGSHFTLYSDDGLDPASDRPCCEILFSWNDRDKSLTTEARAGPTCLKESSPIQMHVVLVAPGHGVGVEPCPIPDKSFLYEGLEVVAHLDGATSVVQQD